MSINNTQHADHKRSLSSTQHITRSLPTAQHTRKCLPTIYSMLTTRGLPTTHNIPQEVSQQHATEFLTPKHATYSPQVVAKRAHHHPKSRNLLTTVIQKHTTNSPERLPNQHYRLTTRGRLTRTQQTHRKKSSNQHTTNSRQEVV